MHKYVLTFSIRSNTASGLAAACAKIESAVGCTMRSSELHGTPAFEGRVLGMRVVLLAWKGLERRDTFQFVGIPDDPAFDSVQGDFQACDISQAVIDLLEAHGANTWWIPSEEELKAEAEYDSEVSRWRLEDLDDSDS